MASEAQIRANRQNASKSTGPTSEPGKRRSRANSLKHGLSASAVVPESLEAIQQRALECSFGLNPQNRYQAWIVNQVAILSLRVDRCDRMERRARDLVSLKACLGWDDDRALQAEALGHRLAGAPGVVVGGLRKTPQGCDWLIDRWSRLADAAGSSGAWTAEQARLAMDLLATPPAFREGRKPWEPLPGPGDSAGAAATGEELAAFATRQVEELTTRRASAAEVDEVERALVEADLSGGDQPEVRLVRRYESALFRKLRWLVDQLKDPTPHAAHQHHLDPAVVAEFEAPAARPTPDEVAAEGWTPEKINPPFDLEPHEYPEPGQTADVPQIVKDRKQQRLARAEARRDARRRKLEKLRA